MIIIMINDNDKLLIVLSLVNCMIIKHRILKHHIPELRNIVHYEYMALAKNTSVLREAMLLFVEPA